MTKHSRQKKFQQKQADLGRVPIFAYVPAEHKEKILEYARKLRENQDQPKEILPKLEITDDEIKLLIADSKEDLSQIQKLFKSIIKDGSNRTFKRLLRKLEIVYSEYMPKN